MDGVLLGLACAVLIAAANFVGALSARKDASITIGFVGQVITIPLVIGLMFVVPPSRVTGPDIAWGLVAGLFQIVGVTLIWRSMASGAMGLLGAINAMVAAVVPAAWAIYGKESLHFLGTIGVLLALGATVLVARAPGDEEFLKGHRSNALQAAGGGTMFGLAYIALAMPHKASSVAPLLAMRVSSAACGAVIAIAAGKALWVRRDNKLGLLPGPLGAASLLLFVVAAHLHVVATTAVVQGLAPLGTALLAYLVLQQRMRRPQLLGFMLAVAATVLLAIR